MTPLLALILAGGLDAPIMEAPVAPIYRDAPVNLPCPRGYSVGTYPQGFPPQDFCKGDPKTKREKPPTECTDASEWIEWIRYAEIEAVILANGPKTKACS